MEIGSIIPLKTSSSLRWSVGALNSSKDEAVVHRKNFIHTAKNTNSMKMAK
jgi:hypothetical protein